jgi:hypothetical protein
VFTIVTNITQDHGMCSPFFHDEIDQTSEHIYGTAQKFSGIITTMKLSVKLLMSRSKRPHATYIRVIRGLPTIVDDTSKSLFE